MNWEYDLNIIFSAILKYSPKRIKTHLFLNYFSKHFKNKYDVTNADLIHFWHIEAAMPFLDKKYIVTCHGTELLKKHSQGFRKELYIKVLENAKEINAISNYTKKILTDNFLVPANKITIIPPPLSISVNNTKKIAKNKKTFIIGTLSRLCERKNVLNIIKALNILSEKNEFDFIFYLAGDGEEKEKIISSLKKSNFKWKYFGEISEEKKKKEFYPSLDVFVLPPLDLPDDVEGFGMVYLEANAYGVPVIAAKTGGVSDAVKENVSGIFTDPKNPEDISRKILYIIKNRDKYYKSTKFWAKKFEARTIAKKFEKLYLKNIKK